jgi:hypothetical protein
VLVLFHSFGQTHEETPWFELGVTTSTNICKSGSGCLYVLHLEGLGQHVHTKTTHAYFHPHLPCIAFLFQREYNNVPRLSKFSI